MWRSTDFETCRRGTGAKADPSSMQRWHDYGTNRRFSPANAFGDFVDFENAYIDIRASPETRGAAVWLCIGICERRPGVQQRDTRRWCRLARPRRGRQNEIRRHIYRKAEVPVPDCGFAARERYADYCRGPQRYLRRRYYRLCPRRLKPRAPSYANQVLSRDCRGVTNHRNFIEGNRSRVEAVRRGDDARARSGYSEYFSALARPDGGARAAA